MPYIPRSQVNFKYTNSGFVEKRSGVPYVGDYIATSDGKYYAGHNTLKLGSELIVREDYLDKEVLMQPIQESEKYFSFVKETRKYNINNSTDFYTNVVHRCMSSHLPMVLQINKDDNSPSNFAIVRMNKDFVVNQKAPNLYDISVTFTEQI